MVEDGEVTIGIDLGGTSTRVGLYDSQMRLLGQRSMPTRVSAGPRACVAEMTAAVQELATKSAPEGPQSKVIGIGIGSPGPINLRTGVLGELPNLPGWGGFPLRDELAASTGQEIVLESDANAAAIAEWKLGVGAALGVSSMVMLTLGTGVGSGFIINGRVWDGMFGMGGEVGHATIDPHGLPCSCGSRGCLEMYASAGGLLRLARQIGESSEGTEALRSLMARAGDFTPQAVASLAAASNDAAARAAFERFGFYLGIGVANIINTLDLPVIVIGGGVAAAWPLFGPSMFKSVRDYSVVYRLVAPTQRDVQEKDRTFIQPAQLGSTAGLLGAALLPRLRALWA